MNDSRGVAAMCNFIGAVMATSYIGPIATVCIRGIASVCMGFHYRPQINTSKPLIATVRSPTNIPE